MALDLRGDGNGPRPHLRGHRRKVDGLRARGQSTDRRPRARRANFWSPWMLAISMSTPAARRRLSTRFGVPSRKPTARWPGRRQISILRRPLSTACRICGTRSRFPTRSLTRRRPSSRRRKRLTRWRARRRAQLDAQAARVQQDVRATEVTRSYAEITAPFAGVVTAKSVDPGTLAVPGTPLLTIEREGAYRLEASVEESHLAAIRVGQPVSVTLDGIDRTLDARVSEIVPAVDAASRSYTVKIDLPAVPALRSGAFGRAAFSVGSRSPLTIPAAAVTRTRPVAIGAGRGKRRRAHAADHRRAKDQGSG